MATATATRPTKGHTDENTRQVLKNPFKPGDTIVIPAGTTFTSTAPTLRGRQTAKRTHKITISETVPATVAPRNSEKGSKVLVRPMRVRAKGSGGYIKDIKLTEKIVRINGKTPEYETITLDPEDS